MDRSHTLQDLDDFGLLPPSAQQPAADSDSDLDLESDIDWSPHPEEDGILDDQRAIPSPKFVHEARTSRETPATQSISQPQPAPAPPPPASQSHFAKFQSSSFTPDDNLSFDSEFARLASSQEWKPGSQEYVRQRTIAIVEELHTHYFSQPSVAAIKEEPEPSSSADEIQEITPQEFHHSIQPQQQHTPFPVPPSAHDPSQIEIRRNGYQSLCREVGIVPPPGQIGECKRRLKAKLVNIVDLIDARRTGKKVKVWEDFRSFKKHTLLPEHRISKEDAKGTVLASLLQHLSCSGARRKALRGEMPGALRTGRVGVGLKRVRSGRVAKR